MWMMNYEREMRVNAFYKTEIFALSTIFNAIYTNVIPSANDNKAIKNLNIPKSQAATYIYQHI